MFNNIISAKQRQVFLNTLLWVLMLAFITGCSQGSGGDVTVESPPDIPVPPNEFKTQTATEQPTTSEVKSPTVKLNVDDPVLKKAIRIAMDRGVLASESSVEKLKLDAPVTRGEFALWLAGFRQLEPTDNLLPTFADVSKEHPQFVAIETVSTAGLMKGKVQKGESRFRPSEGITREAFCALYVGLKKPDMSRYKPDDFDRMRPPQARTNTQSFERFVDYATIAQTYRNHVAIAYRDGVLQQAFGLGPKQLTQGGGFKPHKPVTRMEALLFLARQLG